MQLRLGSPATAPALALAWVTAALSAATAAEPAADPALVAGFRAALAGTPVEFPDRSLDAAEATREVATAWAAYRQAAIDLGWDKELIPLPRALEKLKAMKPEERAGLVQHVMPPG